MKSIEVKEVIEVKGVLGRAKRQSRAKDDSLAADFKTSENKSEDKCNVSNFERSDNFSNFSNS